MIFSVLQALAALWHAAAFGAGGIFVYYSYLALFGYGAYERGWGKTIRHADVHLWLSGIVIVIIGTLQAGTEIYLTNPKLWAKITVIIFWLVSTQYMRRVALPRFKAGKRRAMLSCSSINISCWIYGAFLGCARNLAYGKVTYMTFLAGFLSVILLCTAITLYLERCYRNSIYLKQ